MKYCIQCNQRKDKKEYSKSKREKDGLNTWCKSCHKKYREKNKEYLSAYKKVYSDIPENKERKKQYMIKYHIDNKENILKKKKEYLIKNREWIYHKNNKMNMLRNWENRISCLQVYSNGYMKCELCGIDNIDVLTIDHINGNGAKHRKEIKKYKDLYSWLRDNNFPDGFRVLCRNCNWEDGLFKRYKKETYLLSELKNK